MSGCPHCGTRLQAVLEVAERMALFNADKRVAQAVERAINLTVRTCEDVSGDDSIMRHVDAKKIAALAMGTDVR